MSTDFLGRNFGPLPVRDVMQMLQENTSKPIYTADKDVGKEDIYTQLQQDISKLADKLNDQNDSAEEFAKSVINSFKERKEEASVSKDHLQLISEATQNLWKASQSTTSLGVNLTKLTIKAQKQITSAIQAALGTITTKNVNPVNNTSIANTSGYGGVIYTDAGIQPPSTISPSGGGGGGGGESGGGGGRRRRRSGGSGGGGGGGGGGNTPSSSDLNKLEHAAYLAGLIVGRFKALHKIMVSATDTDFMTHTFSNTLKSSSNFLENIRLIVHQTKGFGSENRNIEKSFLNIAQGVHAAGTTYGEFATKYTDNLQRGLELNNEDEKAWASKFKGVMKYDKLRERSAQKLISITTTALSTAVSLDMETGSINDLFMDWHMHLSMSSMEIAEIGQGMREIARNSGITGKHLESAIKNSDKIIRSLKSAGLSSATAAKNVIELQATMQKYGVGEKNAEMMGALTSRYDFMKSSSELKSMLSRVAFAGGPELVTALQTGEILTSKSNIKKFGAAFESDVKDFLGNFAGDFQALGIQMPTDMKDLDKAIQQLRESGERGKFVAANIDTIAKNRYAGKGIGDLSQMFKAYDEMGKTSSERINETVKKIKEMEDAGETKLDEYKRLKKVLSESQSDQSMSAFRVLNQELKDKKVTSWDSASDEIKTQITKKLSDDMGEDAAKEFTADLGKSGKELLQKYIDRAKEQGIDFTDFLKKRGTNTEEILEGLKKGGPEAMKAMEDMSSSIQQLQKRERTAEDPITDIRRILTEWNTTLTDMFGWLRSGFGHFTTQIVYWAGVIGATLLDILIAVSAFKAFQSIAGLIKGGSAVQTAANSSGIIANSWKFITSTFSTGWSAVVNSFSSTGFIGRMFSSIGGAFTSTGFIGRIFSSIGGAFTGTGFIGRMFSPIIGAFSSTGFIGKIFGSIGRFFTSGGILKVAGKIAAPLALAMGAFSGWKESEGTGRTKGEGALLGALTGGAKTGSWVSEYLGIEKGGTGDKAMGVGSAALWGAGIGVALAPFTGGISIIVGALIGGAVELVKILTEGTDIVQKYFIAPFMLLIDAIKKIATGVWDIVAGIFTLDMSRIIKGFSGIISAVFDYIIKSFTNMVSNIYDIMISLPGLLLKGMKWLWLEMPRMLLDNILSGLKDLAKNEYLAPIIEPVLEIFNVVDEIFSSFYESTKPILDVIEESWNELKKMIEDFVGPLKFLNKEGSTLSWVTDALKSFVKLLAQTVGWLVKITISPLLYTVKAIAWVVQKVKSFGETVGNMAQGIVDWGVWLYDKIIGHSIIPDLVNGIIMWFAKLPILILKGLGNLGIMLATFIKDSILEGLDYIKKIPEKVVEKTQEAAQTIAQASNETAAMSEERIAKQGSSFLAGGGRAVGGLRDIITGENEGRIAGAKKMIGGTIESAASILNPFNWFKEGTREVEQGGLGVLHSGEMVIPKDAWDQIKAIGNKTFGDGGDFTSYIKKLFGFVSSIKDINQPEEKNYNKTLEQETIVKYFNQPDDVSKNSISTAQSAIDKHIVSSKSIIASQKNEGLFDPLENIAEIMQKNVNNNNGLGILLSSAIDTKIQDSIPGIVAQISDSLNYEKEGSEAAESLIKRRAELFGEGIRGEVSSNLMDYRDEIKGEVNTLGRDRTGIESEIEKKKYGETGNSQLISGIDGVNEYLLNKQSRFFEEMIELLNNIKENTKPATTSFSANKIVGNATTKNLSLLKTNINHYSSTFIKGFWDLTLGDMSPGSVITDGRGGEG